MAAILSKGRWVNHSAITPFGLYETESSTTCIISVSGNVIKGKYILINSLATWKFKQNLRHIIFKLMLVIDGWGISCEIALLWMSQDFTDQSTLVQVMAWCHQATSHYLSQCWPRSPYGVTRPQEISVDNDLRPDRCQAITWTTADIIGQANHAEHISMKCCVRFKSYQRFVHILIHILDLAVPK